MRSCGMKTEVLVWGVSGDPPTLSVLRALAACDAPHRFLDQRKLTGARFVVGENPCLGRLDIEGRTIALERIGAVYARPGDIQQIVRDCTKAADVQAQHGVLALNRQLYAWLEMTDARVVNRPSAAWSNDSKPYQAERILENGFCVPPTLVSTTPAAVREFAERHGQVVCKPVGRTRSRVTRLNAASLGDVEAVTCCPTQFQAYVPGVDWRVHVIGDEVHACEIRCAADDYRVAREEAAALPEPIAARCRVLARGLGLTVAGIDLRHGPDDAWHCFEVNPSPVFDWFEQAAGQPLAASLARLLTDACRSNAA
jgi:glutathione synthase/RimK-type ligase-like ATP-grasp enzyme